MLLLFGRGKISDLMGDVAKGIKSFRKGLADDDMPSSTTPAADAKIINGKATVETSETKDKTANG